MSFNRLIRPTSLGRLLEFKPVSPTLMVGLGGTGKEILLRFRRLVVERYGSLEALPFVQFLHLAEKVRLAHAPAKVWLTWPRQGLDHATLAPIRADQRPCLVGVDANDLPRFEKLREILGLIQSPGDSPISYLDIGELDRGRIVFYNELAGVPAFYGSSVAAPRGMKDSYRSYEDKGDLHIERDRFQFGELVPKTAEEVERYAGALRAFVLGRLLGLLEAEEIVERDTDKPSFRYSYRKSDPAPTAP